MNEQIIKKIQQMSEDDFTKKIVMPIFHHLGYEKTIYNGGVNEYGRDIILWGENKIGNKEVAVAQVKMKKLNANTSSNSSFITVINQLAMALKRKILNEDGLDYTPVDAYFVSPQKIETRQLEMASGIISNSTELQFIDLTKLFELIEKYEMKEYIYGIFNDKAPMLQDHLYSEVHNDELTRALAIAGKKDENLYYSDLDLSFLNFKIKIQTRYQYKQNILIRIKKDIWKEFKSKINSENKNLKSFFNIELMEKKHKKYNHTTNISKIATLRTCYSNLNEIKHQIKSNYLEYDSKPDINNKNIDTLQKIYSEIQNTSSEIQNISFELNTDLEPITSSKLNEIEKIIKSVRTKYDFNNIENDFNVKNDLEISILKITIELFEEYLIELKKILNLKLQTIEQESYYTIINYVSLEKYLNFFIMKEKKKLSIDESTIETIKAINLFKAKFFQYNEYFENISFKILLSKQNEILIINKKISDLLNSKINILIEANAGAGKTTSLQHYSKHGDESFLKIYLPLTKVISYIELKSQTSTTNISQSEALFNAICKYINKLNNAHIIDILTLKTLLVKNSTVLLFDGVDEVISKYNWIFNEIQNISYTYNCIVAATTRPNFLDNNVIKNFMKLKLLDFTTEQRIKFIIGWFNKDTQTANKLLKHIEENNIAEIISNPFSATIFCRLAERNIPLPTTETDMYEERLRLLLGAYDLYKDINRNTIYQSDLEKVATKVAFIFHKNNTRSMNFENIVTKLINENLYIGEETIIRQAVAELIQPSNILYDEYDDGELTFGHFRYQEYLVAKELQRNRGINIYTYIQNDYWKGALSLFAQITDDLIHIFEDLLEKDYTLIENKSILLEMISKRRNPKEKEELIKIINKYAMLDKKDMFFDGHTYENYMKIIESDY